MKMLVRVDDRYVHNYQRPHSLRRCTGYYRSRIADTKRPLAFHLQSLLQSAYSLSVTARLFQWYQPLKGYTIYPIRSFRSIWSAVKASECPIWTFTEPFRRM